MSKLDKIINIVRTRLYEEGMTLGSGQIAGTPESGDDPPVRKKKRYIYSGKGSRKFWMKNLKK